MLITETLENLLLGNALQCAGAGKMDRAEWKNWLGVLIGGVLAVAGIVGIVWCPNPLGVRLSEALFVVGVVAAVVYRSKYVRR